jgi:hypothetical protein
MFKSNEKDIKEKAIKIPPLFTPKHREKAFY